MSFNILVICMISNPWSIDSHSIYISFLSNPSYQYLLAPNSAISNSQQNLFFEAPNATV